MAMLRRLTDAERFINRNAGRLPGRAVTRARWLTDTLREIVGTAQIRPLDVQAVVLVRGTLEDYLPTTLHTYLALDDAARQRPQPTEALLEQLEILQQSVSDVLVAVRSQDADALLIQGNFLRTKFSGSDLDLP
ncbi:hypothetical protein [Dactylosporangium fulvum]|uniref:Uncharacterized protein n=1 Tax=Dactylosporangium fulvum TaxID=53359 RepID=A0ABY5VT33_9ACTN|nr:hypothetical protein [Dactylosporangium fulvum]UWP80360.1 hypothetical protein Dfulv_35090 [Dactylosporangium fulvum]